jgi:DNA-binding NarL/FixJ family response regulator
LPIRVLLSELDPVIREIVAPAIRSAPDMTLVGICDEAADAIAVMIASHVDVAIVPASSAVESPSYRAVAATLPNLRLLEIGEEEFDVYELRLLAHDPNVGAVLESIRNVAARIG